MKNIKLLLRLPICVLLVFSITTSFQLRQTKTFVQHVDYVVYSNSRQKKFEQGIPDFGVRPHFCKKKTKNKIATPPRNKTLCNQRPMFTSLIGAITNQPDSTFDSIQSEGSMVGNN